MFSTHRYACAALILTATAAAQNTFEVASIKPNMSATTSMKFPFPSGGRFTGTNLNLVTLITFAYGVQGFQIENAPPWLKTDRYDITAKAAAANVSIDQYHQMLQALLAERFRLTVHRETKQVPIYVITPAKNGGKLEESRPDSCIPPGPTGVMRTPGQPEPVVCGSFFTGPASLDVRKMAMSGIAGTLAILLGRPVVDQTGFTGTYDFHLEFQPEGVMLQPGAPAGLDTGGNGDTRPSIYTALQQQLGLKLESQKGPSEVLVIDHIERVPVDN